MSLLELSNCCVIIYAAIVNEKDKNISIVTNDENIFINNKTNNYGKGRFLESSLEI